MKPALPRALLAFLILLALFSSACMAVTGALPGAEEPAPKSEPETQETIQALLTEDAALMATENGAVREAATAEAVYTQAAATQIAAMLTQAPGEAEPTRAPEATVTAIVAPTAAPALATSTTAPAVALPADLEVFRHREIPGFVFPVDPNLWELTSHTDYPWAFLSHRSIMSCKILAVPGRGIGTPNRVLRWQLGRLFWYVLDYGNNALVSIDQPRGLFLELQGFNNAQCRQDQQAVMQRVMLEDELNGRVALAALPTPTQRPPLPGFSCPNTPSARLRVGDRAYIVTNDLYLRSEPRPSRETVTGTYDATDPVMVQVLEGPVCTEKFVYWKVSIALIGEGVPEPVTGWMAEGDLREYYLEPAR